MLRFYFKLIKREYYVHIPIGQLFLNWIFQRLFFRGNEFKYSLNYSSRLEGAKNLIIEGNSSAVLTSFAMSGGFYIAIYPGTTLEIGEGTIWSNNICIQTANHGYLDRNKFVPKSVKIGKNCWIANGAVILSGVELGDNVTVGANAVVTKSFPSNSVIAGVPAKVIKTI